MKRKSKPERVTAEQLAAITKAMGDLDKKFAVMRFCGTAEPWILAETLSQRTASQLLAKLNGNR